MSARFSETTELKGTEYEFSGCDSRRGKGTRMKSELPKVLHPIAGRPMVQHVVDAAGALSPANTVIVYGHGGDRVREVVTGERLQWAEQAEQLGTGHAVAQALPHLDEDVVLVLYGDVPLIRPETLRRFVGRVNDQSLALMTLELQDPAGYGRVVRDDQGRVTRIVEQKDASDEENVCARSTPVSSPAPAAFSTTACRACPTATPRANTISPI